MQLLCVHHHRVAAVRGDDGQADVAALGGHRREMRLSHGPGVEGGDLVVGLIGDDDGLRGVVVVDAAHAAQVQPQALQPRPVILPVRSQGGHDDRLTAQGFVGVGDVARTPTVLAPQGGHQEGHVQDVHLFRQDLLCKAPLEVGDGVKGQGSADQGRHGEAP